MLTPPSSIEPAATDQAARLHVLVICGKVVATYPLPEHGHVRIGRSPSCEILIDDTSISRTHASISLGPPLVITDLGSANGTRVRDQRIPPQQATSITPGEAIQIGAATLIVQKQAAPMRPRRLWAHDYFEVRLEEECVRAARHGTMFAVMRLSCAANTPEDVMQHALANLVQVSDVVGLYGPNEYEVLLVDTDLETIEATAKRFTTTLEAHGINVRVGTACYPRDGHGADELMGRAEASARGPVAKQRGVLVADRTMQDLYALAERVAIGTISVLILGETGVGKEILAEQVHKVSPRASKPYLRLNCAALTESLLESELFGYERGAFTGAVQTKQGLLETADGGSIFLDEVGELPMSTQVKLLRVIEERIVMRVGGLKPRPLDVRFIAATNRDLEAEIARGTFRQDLYFRLNGATLIIPPLRDRAAEIPPLAAAFIKQATRLAGLDREPKLSPEALDHLMRYSWPGNIRELRNVIERAVLLCGTNELQPRHLPLEKMRVTFAMPAPSQPLAQVAAQATNVQMSPARMLPTDTPTETRVVPALLRRGRRLSADEERAQIEAALQACGGNQTRAAKLLGIGRRTLINRVQEFGLARPRAGNEATETLDAVGDTDADDDV